MKKFIISLLVLLCTYYSYSECINCPKSILAPGSAAAPLSGFNGTTGEVTDYTGTPISCFLPASNTLNGVIEGIDNELCELQDLIDSLEAAGVVDSAAIAAIEADIDSLYALVAAATIEYDILSDNGSVDITTTTADGIVNWDLAVNIQSIQDSLLANLDASCLTDSTGWDDIMQTLIDVVCALNTAATDTCEAWDLTFTASTSTSPTAIAISATASEVTPAPSNMQITDIIYYYYVYDADTVVITSGYVNAPTTLDAAYAWYVPATYQDGARFATVVGRIYKEVTATGAYCGFDDTTYTLVISAPDLDAMTANNYTNDTVQPSTTFNIPVTSNDVIPYTLATLAIVTSPVYGTVNSTSVAGGTVNFTADATTGVVDSFSYRIVDVYSQSDTAWVFVPVENCTDSSFLSRVDSICVTRTGHSSFLFNPYYNVSITGLDILTWSLDLSYAEECDAAPLNGVAMTTTGVGTSISGTTGGLSSGNLTTQITQNYTGAIDACGGTLTQTGATWSFTIEWTDACGTEQIETLELSLPAATYSTPQSDCY